MIDERMHALGANPSSIRELFAYGQKRKAEIGADKVFDFSLGNPSVPAPPQVGQAIQDLAQLPPEQLHAYTPSQGSASCRQAIADDLNRRFGTSYGPDDLYMTMGAAASLACSLQAITCPGDEVIVISPYFPEYRMWIEAAGCTCIEVPADPDGFQIDCDALYEAIGPGTSALIINSPNNPVGVVYSQGNLEHVAATLRQAELEQGHPIFLISDEPYRELVYGDTEVPWVPSIYENTLVCYSWSKSLSLPGERIGYILVSPEADDAERVYKAVCGAGRALGYVCAPALFQEVIQRCLGLAPDIESYRENRRLLTGILDRAGYTYIDPQGAFYLWVKALEDDARAFSAKAKEHEILLVPSDDFGSPGWCRIGYCVSRDTIVNSEEAFRGLAEDYR